jgi:PIN domain nuclease of toxin-antitoxin system
MFERGFVISVVTACEYADLLNRGRLPDAAALDRLVDRFEAEVLDLPGSSWPLATGLPRIHRDPVDRMLIAHVLATDGVLATADKLMRSYPVPLLW